MKSYLSKQLDRYVYLGARIFIVTLLGLSPAGCYWIKAVSVDGAGDTVGVDGGSSSLSSDGRYVTFVSIASTLVTGDTNNEQDVYVRDLLTGDVTRVSIDSSGIESNSGSILPAVSADGRYVAFQSFATNLVAGDTNNNWDVFVHDTQTGVTERVGIDSSGNAATSGSFRPSISSDGRYIAFDSFSANLVEGDSNSTYDVFVHDTQTGVTERVSVDSTGNEGNERSQSAKISADGRYVAFQSLATNLVTDDTNGAWDVFVHDTQTGVTERVSTDSIGNEGDSDSFAPVLSANGRQIAFRSLATNLVVGDTNAFQDVFVHDTQTGVTTRVSVDSTGGEGNERSQAPSISADGRYVAFQSFATNLVADDTNGWADIFVHDMQTGLTMRVNTDRDGNEADYFAGAPSVSADGRYVVFVSNATNLIPNDTNGFQDMFIRAVPHVAVTSVSPEHLPVGATTSVVLTGSYFLPGVTVGVSGAGKTITNKKVVDENTITMDITISPGAATGTRSITVSLPGTGPGTFAGVSSTCEDCVTFQ